MNFVSADTLYWCDCSEDDVAGIVMRMSKVFGLLIQSMNPQPLSKMRRLI